MQKKVRIVSPCGVMAGLVPVALALVALCSINLSASELSLTGKVVIQNPHSERMARSATGEFIEGPDGANSTPPRNAPDASHATAAQPSTSPVTFTSQSSTLFTIATDAVVVGNYAYCAAAPGLTVFDVTVPSNPTRVGDLRLTFASGTNIWDIAVYGNYLYIPSSSVGVYVVDISTPASPTLVTINTYVWGSFRIIVDGSYAYVCNNLTPGIIGVLDLSTPSNPVGIGTVSLTNSTSCLNKSGNYVFASGWYGDVTTVDVSVPSTPTVVGTPLPLPYAIWNTAMSGNLICGVDLNGYMAIVDVTNPFAPALVGSYTTVATQGVGFLNGTTIVLGRKDQGIEVVDVSTPATPTSLGVVGSIGWLSSVMCVGTQAYVAAQDGGLRIFDLSTPSAPSLLGAYTTGYIYSVKVAGNYAYVGSGIAGLQIVDISNPSAPTTVSQLSIPTLAYYLDLSGNYAYIPASTSGLQIVDVSNPASPSIVGSYDTPGDATQVVVRGNYAYVADYAGGLCIIDVTNPAAPTFVGAYVGSSTVARVALSGNYAYIGNRGSGLLVVDISNPAAPTFAAGLSIPGDARGVTIRGQRAYVAMDWGYLRTVDISNPLAPILLPSYAFDPYGAFGVSVSGGNVFAMCAGINGFAKMVALDVGDPMLQAYAGSYGSCNSARTIDIQGDVLCLSDGYGLQILKVGIPCCLATTGNVDCDLLDKADISDLTALIDNLYLSLAPLCCTAEANVNGSIDGKADISDLTALIDYLYLSFTSPAACQ